MLSKTKKLILVAGAVALVTYPANAIRNKIMNSADQQRQGGAQLNQISAKNADHTDNGSLQDIADGGQISQYACSDNECSDEALQIWLDSLEWDEDWGDCDCEAPPFPTMTIPPFTIPPIETTPPPETSQVNPSGPPAETTTPAPVTTFPGGSGSTPPAETTTEPPVETTTPAATTVPATTQPSITTQECTPPPIDCPPLPPLPSGECDENGCPIENLE
eukprot:403344060